MTDVEFIENYCVVNNNGKYVNIKLKEYQKNFLKYLKKLRK